MMTYYYLSESGDTTMLSIPAEHMTLLAGVALQYAEDPENNPPAIVETYADMMFAFLKETQFISTEPRTLKCFMDADGEILYMIGTNKDRIGKKKIMNIIEASSGEPSGVIFVAETFLDIFIDYLIGGCALCINTPWQQDRIEPSEDIVALDAEVATLYKYGNMHPYKEPGVQIDNGTVVINPNGREYVQSLEEIAAWCLMNDMTMQVGFTNVTDPESFYPHMELTIPDKGNHYYITKIKTIGVFMDAMKMGILSRGDKLIKRGDEYYLLVKSPDIHLAEVGDGGIYRYEKIEEDEVITTVGKKPRNKEKAAQ